MTKTNSDTASQCMRLQQLLPHRRRESRFQSHHHACSDLSTIPRIRGVRHSDRLHFRQIQRTMLAHYRRHGHGHCRFRHLMRHTQRSRSIHLVLPLRIRSLLRQFCHPWLGVCNPWPDYREEGRLAIHCQCRCQRILHLYGILVSEERWTKVPDGHGKQCGFCFHDHCLCMVPQDLAAEDEQEAQGSGQGQCGVLCVLRFDIGKILSKQMGPLL